MQQDIGSSEEKKSLTKKEVALRTLALLRKRYPVIETHLVHNSPWELLIATVLAAQCTDARVNTVTPKLFDRWPTAKELSTANVLDVEEVVRPTGFYHNKAKNIVATAKRITEIFGGVVPNTMDDLISLPGVARKTANVVLWGSFKINSGIAVDTHVGRIVYRLGLVKGKDPKITEKELMKLFPKDSWGDVNHMLVWFGRHICDARKPLCSECEFASFCKRRDVVIKKSKSLR